MTVQVTDPIARDLAYHIIRMPGPIEESDATLDLESQNGYELVNIYGPNAVFRSTTIANIGGEDAFGRDRVSEPYSIGSYKTPYGIPLGNTLDVTSSIGINQVTPNPLRASFTLSAHGPSSSYAIHQSRKYHNYIPGKSQYILQSFLMGSATSGSIKRIGYFDDKNGIFLEQDATGSLNWVVRSNASGSIEETRIPQTNWNVRTLLDGPFVLDVTKTQLLFIDFQWLGVGRIRTGLVYNGQPFLTHVFDHTNFVDKVYMAQPNLPIRYEIRNVANASGSMESICAAVSSEGGTSDIGKTWSISTGTQLVTLTSGSTLPVLAVRLKNAYTNGYENRAYLKLLNGSGFATDKSTLMRVLKLPNKSYLTTSSAWISVNDESVAEYNIGSTAFTDGREIVNGFIPGGGQGLGNIQSAQDTGMSNSVSDNFIAQNYDSTDSEIYILVLTNLTAQSTTVGGSLQWIEVY